MAKMDCSLRQHSVLSVHTDSIIHDMAIPNLPVVLCLDRAGLGGRDGNNTPPVLLTWFSRVSDSRLRRMLMTECELRFC